MLSRMIKTEVHHQFSPPLAKQKENENWQTPAHPSTIINFTIHLTSFIDFLKRYTIQT